MENGYFDNLRNKDITSFVLDRSNVGKLEHLLAAGSDDLMHLEPEFHRFHKGKRIKNKELSGVFNDVKVGVDSFLAIHDIEPCRCLYNSSYNLPRNIAYSLMNPSFAEKVHLGATLSILTLTQFIKIPAIYPALLLSSLCMPLVYKCFGFLMVLEAGSIYYKKSILLEKELPAILIPVIAHEYAHHIQANMFDVSYRAFSILCEGHARGVQRHIAQLYCEKEDNELFLYYERDEFVQEMKSVYSWCCKHNEITPDRSLLKVVKKDWFSEWLYLKMYKRPYPHAIGNAFFSILELDYGKDIYRQVVHKEFEFKK